MFKLHIKKLTVDISSIENIAKIEYLSRKEFRVLFFLMARLESTRLRSIDKSKIAEELNMSKKDVKDAIETLVDCEILIKGSDAHVDNGYKFNL